MATGNNRIHGNMIANHCISYFASYLNNFAHKFMTNYTGIGSKSIFPW